MTTSARAERAALADLLTEVGPDAPTLCEGWTTRDLAAHLVVRDRRPDAAAGLVVGPLAAWTRHVQDGVARGDWAGLVDKVRSGPRIPLGPLDAPFNTAEYFVHHEDVRRAQPGWEPRPTDERLERAQWGALTARARMLFRRSPVGVTLRLPDGTTHTARSGERSVTLTGPATELCLFAHGRRDQSLVEVEGEPDVVAEFEAASLAL